MIAIAIPIAVTSALLVATGVWVFKVWRGWSPVSHADVAWLELELPKLPTELVAGFIRAAKVSGQLQECHFRRAPIERGIHDWAMRFDEEFGALQDLCGQVYGVGLECTRATLPRAKAAVLKQFERAASSEMTVVSVETGTEWPRVALMSKLAGVVYWFEEPEDFLEWNPTGLIPGEACLEFPSLFHLVASELGRSEFEAWRNHEGRCRDRQSSVGTPSRSNAVSRPLGDTCVSNLASDTTLPGSCRSRYPRTRTFVHALAR